MCADSLESNGYVLVPGVLNPRECAVIAENLDTVPLEGAGSRRLLRSPWCQDIAAKLRSDARLVPLLPPEAVAVQCISFEKARARNWLVALHQDRSVPVRERLSGSSLSGWSEKEGEIFVHAPAEVLENLTAVRVHIDSCPADSGALRIVPGSHRAGVLSAADANDFRRRAGEIVLPAAQGDALVIKPLLLHASSKSSSGSRRRVLHFVFGPRTLPFGLQWRQNV